MGGQNNWPTQRHAGDWMRQMERRMLNEERRPSIRSASDLLGPGLGPYAVFLNDWNADEAAFNGIFYSEPGALHAPDSTLYWMGQTLGSPDGFGIQRLWEIHVATPANPIREFMRRFYDPGTGGTRSYGAWFEQFSHSTTPRAKIVTTATQTIGSSGTATKITFDTVQYNYGCTTDLTNERITILTDGLYHIFAAVELNAPTSVSGRVFASVRKNGASGAVLARSELTQGTSASLWAIPLVSEKQLVAGDYVELYIAQTSGLSVDTNTAALETTLSVRRVADKI